MQEIPPERRETDDAHDSCAPPQQARQSRVRRLLSHPLVHVVLAVAVLSLVQGFFIKLYSVPSGSMEPTLVGGDRILVNRLANAAFEPATGDVVVFNADGVWRPSQDEPAWKTAIRWVSEVTSIGPGYGRGMVKRVIAGPGQSISCCGENGEFIVDGTLLEEPFSGADLPFEAGVLDCRTTPSSARCVTEFEVPEDSYVVLGDNRSNSSDSLSYCRGQPETGLEEGCARLVSRDSIIGPVFAVVWPIDRWGFIDS